MMMRRAHAYDAPSSKVICTIIAAGACATSGISGISGISVISVIMAATAPMHAAAVPAASAWSEGDATATVARLDGTVVRGAITSIDEKGVSLKAGDGPDVHVAWSECFGLLTDAEPYTRNAVRSAIASLASGERLPGGVEANASGLRWSQRWLGMIDLPAEGIRWISFDGEPPVDGAADADVVRLLSADRLEGFVTTLADPLPFESRTPGSVSRLPLDGVQSISFVTTGAETAPRSTRRLWLADGTVLDASKVSLRPDGSLTLGGLPSAPAREIVVPLGVVLAIEGARNPPALASQALTTVANDQSAALRYEISAPQRLRWPHRRPASGAPPAPAAAVGADDGAWPLGLVGLAFDGPAILRAEIAEPATLLAVARLPDDRRPHGRFELVVRSGGREIARRAVDPGSPPLEISAQVEPPSVEFEIIDTGSGGVQDGIVIERAMLTPRTAPAATPSGRSAPQSSQSPK